MAQHKKDYVLSWERDQIEKYEVLFPVYKKYAETLQRILENVARKYAPFAVVQSRPKSIASFAEKIQRKRVLYKNPLKDMTDLCGARVITHTQDEVRNICGFIEKNFEIDWENSIDVTQRLKPAEFGYRSVHYIVLFRPGVFPAKNIDVEIAKELFGLKAEVQVRTLLEHAWADFTHERTYKCAFKIPEKWQRELAGIAAMLEGADKEFLRIDSELKVYASNYGNYMSKDRIRHESDILEEVLKYDRHDLGLVSRIGKLAMTVGDWKKAIKIFSPYVNADHQPILRDLGVSLCKWHKDKPKGRAYRQGQKYLEAACALNNRDVDALASLAGTWKGIDEDKVRQFYRQAFEIDPTDSYPLVNFLDYEISFHRDVSSISCVKPIIEAAIQRCRKQLEVGTNLPWGFYSLGKLYLYLNKPYDSLSAYAKAMTLSTDNWMLDTSLNSLKRIEVVQEKLYGYPWVHKLLQLGKALRFGKSDALKNELKKKAQPVLRPVVIVAGGCDKSIEKQMRSYRQMCLGAFRNFKGTVMSGGIASGVSGLVGELQRAYPKNIHTIGYVPKTIPSDVVLDRRYSEIRITQGEDFTPLESLQMWIDLALSGVNPAEVKVLGINGGANSAFEYRLALAFGASVAVIKDSGGEAGKLLLDSDWANSGRLFHFPADAMLLKSFINYGNHQLQPKAIREKIARAFHENHRRVKSTELHKGDLSMADWDKLPENLKDSNRQLADSIEEKLETIGYVIKKSETNKIKPLNFRQAELEKLSEMEHARWVIERLLDGWKIGEVKDVQKKISPYLVSWQELPENVKEWDRMFVRKIPQFLEEAGLVIRKQRL